MHAHSLAAAAYAPTTPAHSPQSTEYRAFARVTQQLTTQLKNPGDFQALIRAISENRRLWTLLSISVADEANQLPKSLRAQIFYLAEFTDSHSRQVLRKEADVRPLVEINTAIMKGLRAQMEAA